jgi:hypothetical protein
MKTYTFKLLLLLLPVALLVAGCNKEEDPSAFAGKDNYITAFTLQTGSVTLKAAISSGAVVLTAPEQLPLSGATATVKLSENATISPDPATITDWDAAQTFTVTAHDGTNQAYAYSVERHLVERDGDVTLLTQADVEVFVAGLDADHINGLLTIGAATGQDSVYSLAGLERLKIITGGVIINATYAGKTLTAFESLERTGELKIFSNKVKTVCFPRLASVRLDFEISHSTGVYINSLEFPELVTVDKGMRIQYPDSLVSIRFPKLEQVLEALYVSGHYSGVNTLRSLEFPALKKIGGEATLYYLRKLERMHFPELASAATLTVQYLDSATSFAAPKLETVTNFSLMYNPELLTADFSALKTMSGVMKCYTNGKLSGLSFPALMSAGTLEVGSGMSNIERLDFPALKTIGTLYLEYENKLTSLTGFPVLDSINTRLFLSTLPRLASIDLPSLKKIGTVYASQLPNLTEIDLRGVKVEGSLLLSNTTLDNLTLIGDDEFTGTLELNSPSSTLTAFPFTIQQGFKTLGGLVISAGNVTAIDFPWLERVTGLLNFSSGSTVKKINLPNLQTVGGFQVASYYNALETLELPELEIITGYTSGTATVGNFTYGVTSNITAVELPKLRSVVGNVSITGLTATRKLGTIRFPALESLTGTLAITGTSNAVFKDLSGFSALTSAGGVTISNFTQLKDFEPLKGLFTPTPAFAADTWKISGCAYNPTYQDMVDGKYTN